MPSRPCVLIVLEPPATERIVPQLRRHGMKVSVSSLGDLESQLSTEIDLVVVGLPRFAPRTHPTLLNLRLQLARARVDAPLVAWAPWAEQDDVPARSLVHAVVPAELPPAAIAHRLAVLARRAVTGIALERGSSLPPARSPRAVEQRARVATRPPPPRPSAPASRPSAPASGPSAPASGPPAPAPSEAGVTPELPGATLLDSAPPESEWSEDSPAPDSETDPDSCQTVRKIPLSSGSTQAPASEHPSAASPPASRPSATSRLRKSPSSIRVPLTSPRESSAGVRVLLIDHDLTRADAVGTTLRAKRIAVHPTSPEVADLHLRLARRFSPHGVIVDESVLRGRGAPLIELLRSDPFLRHAQLIVVKLERLFRSDVGATTLATLLPLLEPLGRAEVALFEKLGPTCEVEMSLSEIPAHLLLRLLATRTIRTDLTCTSATSKLEWSISNAGCGSALLFHRTRRVERLTAEAAVKWMLERPDARVVVTQRSDPSVANVEPLTPVIDELIRSFRIPDGVWEIGSRIDLHSESLPAAGVRPGGVSSSPSPEGPAPVRLAPTSPESSAPPVSLAEASKRTKGTGRWVLAAALVCALAALVFARMGPLPSAAERVSSPEDTLTSQVDAAQPEAPGREPAKPGADERVPRSPVPGPATEEEQAVVDGEQSEPRAAEEPTGRDGSIERGMESAARPAGPLAIAPGTCQVPRCDPKQALPGSSSQLVQGARRDLVEGRGADALAKLCSAAQVEPQGDGALALAEYYLERHCPRRAQATARQVLSTQRGERQVERFRADLAHQLGDEDAALTTLLDALGVAETDTRTLQAVSRKYLADARMALQHSALALAERDLRRAVLLWPSHQAAKGLLARVLERRGLDELSLSWARRVLEEHPGEPLATGVFDRHAER